MEILLFIGGLALISFLILMVVRSTKPAQTMGGGTMANKPGARPAPAPSARPTPRPTTSARPAPAVKTPAPPAPTGGKAYVGRDGQTYAPYSTPHGVMYSNNGGLSFVDYMLIYWMISSLTDRNEVAQTHGYTPNPAHEAKADTYLSNPDAVVQAGYATAEPLPAPIVTDTPAAEPATTVPTADDTPVRNSLPEPVLPETPAADRSIPDPTPSIPTSSCSSRSSCSSGGGSSCSSGGGSSCSSGGGSSCGSSS